tara:strand:+ start:204 stop:1610 length:1407 start_codon:yes stop_codon:yes gene_type:complete
MSHLNFKSQENIKDIVIRYLNGENLDVFKVKLTLLSTEHQKSCKELFQKVKLDLNDAYVKAIFQNISVPLSKQNDILNRYNNLYELLIHFEYIGKHQFEYLIKTIDETHPPKSWWIIAFIGAFITGGLSILFHYKPDIYSQIEAWCLKTFPKVMLWAEKTFSALKNFALIGLIYNMISLLFTWYHAFQYRLDAKVFRISSLVFDTLSSLFTITALATSYFLSGALATASACFFILSSVTDLVRSIYFLWSSNYILKDLNRPAQDASVEEQLEYARANNLYQRSLQTLYLKIGVALAITIAVVVTSIVPVSLPVTVGCFAFIALLQLAQYTLKNAFKNHYAKALQEETAQICETADEAKFDQTKAASRVNQGWKLLHVEKRQLEQEKIEFEVEKQRYFSKHADNYHDIDSEQSQTSSAQLSAHSPKENINSSDHLSLPFKFFHNHDSHEEKTDVEQSSVLPLTEGLSPN